MIASGSQTVGPFFKEAMDRPAWADLTRAGAEGERIRIVGRVFDGAHVAVPDAWLEIWQANADGRYVGDAPSGFNGFGRCCTDDAGRFAFTTIRPGAVPAPNGALQAPHIAVSIFARGLLKRLVTRIYFPDRADANAADPLLRAIADDSQRATLVAHADARDDRTPVFRFDVVLQGAGETAFLAV
jgi:protocatechuate 3,4-dioxygenase alpha subunit